MIEIIPFGDQAILINFEQKIDPTVNRAVLKLSTALNKKVGVGLQFNIPAYCSLSIGYEPRLIDFTTLRDLVLETYKSLALDENQEENRILSIPVCYEAPFCLDRAELETLLPLKFDEIIQKHTSTRFRIYMLGFLPGFAYMGRLPEDLKCPRKQKPRLKVPAGAVGLAGYQTGIYPSEAPGGWQIIGQTPLPIIRTNQQPFFIWQAGDWVQFTAISKEDYVKTKQAIQQQSFDWNSIYASN